MAVNFSESKTKENLMRAFAGESQARNRYSFAADLAKQQNMRVIEVIFRFTAEQEYQHAKIFYDFLKQENGTTIEIDGGYPVEVFDDLPTMLRAAQHDEYEEHRNVYPSFAKIAREEGFEQIATAFDNIAEIEKTHGNRFGAFAELMEQNKLFCAEPDTEWICLNCGYIFKGKEPPQKCPVCQHEQGYFIPYKYYNFMANDYEKPQHC